MRHAPAILRILLASLFELRPLADEPDRIQVALVTMRWEEDGPASAVVITPDPNGTAAEVADLLRPGRVEIVEIAPDRGR